MHEHRFDPKHLAKLNDPERLADVNPDRLLAAAGAAAWRTVVDMGAGTGLFAVELARRLPVATVYAVDVAPEMIEWMAGHLPDDVRGRVRPLLSDGVTVLLPDAHADLVVLINVYHEFDERPRVLAELRRLLRPGGTVLVADWKAEETPTGPPLWHRVPEDAIRQELAAAGFEAIQSHPGLAYHGLLTGRRPPG